MARNPAGIGELAEELLQARLVVGDVGAHLAVGTVEQALRGAGRPSVARAHEEHRVLIVVGDKAVHVGKQEVDARRGAPVAHQAVLDVVAGEATATVEVLAHERVGAQVDLADGEVVGAAPVAVYSGERLLADRSVELDPRCSYGFLRHAGYPFLVSV